jgi:hypothetical protein
MLGRLGRHEQRVTFCEEVVRRFGTAEDPGVRCSVADVLNCKGGSLEELGRSAEAIAAYDEVEQRFGGDTNADVQESVAEARSSKRELVHESDGRSP